MIIHSRSFNESLDLPRVEMATQERFYIRYGINAVQWVLGNAFWNLNRLGLETESKCRTEVLHRCQKLYMKGSS